MEDKRPLESIPDDELLHRLGELMGQSRRVEADIVAHIAEVEERRLYARQAFPSMFAYCTDALHLSEAEAYRRIAAARASLAHPVLLTMLADGRLHLTAIALLAPHLTCANRNGLLERATHRSKRQVQELVAEIAPRPDVPAVMRKVSVSSELRSSELPRLTSRREAPMEELVPDGVPAVVAVSAPPVVSPSIIQPLSPGRYKVQFTASAELHEKLERLRALMGSKVPKGDLAAIIEQAVTEKLERLEASRFAGTTAPRKGLAATAANPSSRHIPAAVRREVSERDGNRCRYVDDHGRRCPERNRLEFHHVHPFGVGGGHSTDNIRLLCHGHNAYLADCDYGRDAMARHRRAGHGAAPSPTG